MATTRDRPLIHKKPYRPQRDDSGDSGHDDDRPGHQESDRRRQQGEIEQSDDNGGATGVVDGDGDSSQTDKPHSPTDRRSGPPRGHRCCLSGRGRAGPRPAAGGPDASRPDAALLRGGRSARTTSTRCAAPPTAPLSRTRRDRARRPGRRWCRIRMNSNRDRRQPRRASAENCGVASLV